MSRKDSKGMSGHHSAKAKTHTWLTPPHIIEALGPFDLDPCTPPEMPWKTADRRFTKTDDGLSQDWGEDFVWMNPPYGREAGKWLKKLSGHDNGIALIFARTETQDWFNYVWPYASAILFMKGRIHFHDAEGNRADANSGAPSALIGYGLEANDRLYCAADSLKIQGAFIDLSDRGGIDIFIGGL